MGLLILCYWKHTPIAPNATLRISYPFNQTCLMKTLIFSTILAMLGVTVLTSGLSSVSAQDTKNTFDGRVVTDTSDNYVPGSGGGGLDLTSIIHNANLTNGRSMGQFRKAQDENMSDQVEKFRNRQPLEIKGLGGKTQTVSPETKEVTSPSQDSSKAVSKEGSTTP
jgi:hypothetical protein